MRAEYLSPLVCLSSVTRATSSLSLLSTSLSLFTTSVSKSRITYDLYPNKVETQRLGGLPSLLTAEVREEKCV